MLQLVGAGLLLVGVWVMFHARDYAAINSDLLIPSLMMSGVGLVITLISLFGIAGVIRENNCLLIFVSASSTAPILWNHLYMLDILFVGWVIHNLRSQQFE